MRTTTTMKQGWLMSRIATAIICVLVISTLSITGCSSTPEAEITEPVWISHESDVPCDCGCGGVKGFVYTFELRTLFAGVNLFCHKYERTEHAYVLYASDGQKLSEVPMPSNWRIRIRRFGIKLD